MKKAKKLTNKMRVEMLRSEIRAMDLLVKLIENIYKSGQKLPADLTEKIDRVLLRGK